MGVLLGFTGFYGGFTWFYGVLLDSTWFSQVLLGSAGFYWVLLGFTGTVDGQFVEDGLFVAGKTERVDGGVAGGIGRVLVQGTPVLVRRRRHLTAKQITHTHHGFVIFATATNNKRNQAKPDRASLNLPSPFVTVGWFHYVEK